MKIKQTTLHGTMPAFDVLDNSGERIASLLDEQLARQFAASDKMLAVLRKLGDADNYALPDGSMYIEYIDIIAEARDMAREIVAELEE